MTVEILSELTHVGHLLENIELNDMDVLAALSSVSFDDNANGMINEFERAVDFLLPTDPVKNKKKRGHVQISYVSTPRTDGKGKGKVREKGKWGKKAYSKHSTRKTGVELRYYKSDEFSTLIQKQQDELQDHCNSNGNYKEIWSGKALGSAKYNNNKGNYLTIARFPSILKEHDSVKEKNAASKNEMVAATK